MVHYIKLKTPASSKSKSTYNKIYSLIIEHGRAVEISWILDGVAPDDVLNTIQGNFQVLKNRAFFNYDNR